MDVDRVARLVSEAFHFGKQVGLDGWQALGRARFYGRRHEYLGASLLSEYLSRATEDNAHVVMPGETCAVGVDALLQLLTRLRMWSSRCAVARLDVAVDGVPFTPTDAYSAVRAGHMVSWVKRGRDDAISYVWHSSNRDDEGRTLYVGRRSSQRFMRIYDRRGPTRIELETKDAYADALARELVERRGDDAELARFVVGCLREFCDFGVQDGAHGSSTPSCCRGGGRSSREPSASASWSWTGASSSRSIARCAGWTGPSCRAWPHLLPGVDREAADRLGEVVKRRLRGGNA